jgi:uncharacterized protein (UPF0548 family)
LTSKPPLTIAPAAQRAAIRRSVAALRGWQVHRRAGLAVYASQASAQPGAVVTLLLGRAGIGLYAPCRVVYVMDQPTKQGFAYGTPRSVKRRSW